MPRSSKGSAYQSSEGASDGANGLRLRAHRLRARTCSDAVILQVPPIDDRCIRLPRCRKLVARENRALSQLRKFEPGNQPLLRYVRRPAENCPRAARDSEAGSSAVGNFTDTETRGARFLCE